MSSSTGPKFRNTIPPTVCTEATSHLDSYPVSYHEDRSFHRTWGQEQAWEKTRPPLDQAWAVLEATGLSVTRLQPPGEGFITSLGHVIALAHIYGKAGKNVSENHISCTPQPGLGGPGDPVPTPSL